MKRKKNLERAIILGLILSTGVYGTAWAEEYNEADNPYKEGITVAEGATDEHTVTGDVKFELADEAWITNNGGTVTVDGKDTNGNLTVTTSGENIIKSDGGSTTITLDKDIDLSVDSDDLDVAGISNLKGNLKIESNGDIKINATSTANTNGDVTTVSQIGDFFGSDSKIEIIAGGAVELSTNSQSTYGSVIDSSIYMTTGNLETIIQGDNVKIVADTYEHDGGSAINLMNITSTENVNKINIIGTGNKEDNYIKSYTSDAINVQGNGISENGVTITSQKAGNIIEADDFAISAQSGYVNLDAATYNKITSSTSEDVIRAWNYGTVELNAKSNEIIATENGTALMGTMAIGGVIDETIDRYLSVTATEGNNIVESNEFRAINSNDGYKINLIAEKGNNIIKGYSNKNSDNSIMDSILIENASLTVEANGDSEDTGINEIWAGRVTTNINNLTTGNYDALKISGSQNRDNLSTATFTADTANKFYGSLYAEDKSVVDITSKDNVIGSRKSSLSNLDYSYAVVADGNSLKDDVATTDNDERTQINITSNGGANTIFSTGTIDDERTVFATEGGVVNIEGTSIITADGWAKANETSYQANNTSQALIAGTYDWGNTTPDFDVVDEERSEINLTYGSGSAITGDIAAGYAGSINITGQNSANSAAGISLMAEDEETSAAGNSLTIMGNALAANGGKINLELGKGSVWHGRADDYQDAADETWKDAHLDEFAPVFSNGIQAEGSVDVTLNEARWDVVGQSWLTTLDGNGGVVDMRNTAGDASRTSHAVHIGELNGSHTFVMDLDTNHTESDMLYIKDMGANSGTQTLWINSIEGLENLGENGTLRFATVSSGDIKFKGQYNFGGYGNAKNGIMLMDNGVLDTAYKIVREDYDTNKKEENTGYNGGTGFDEVKPGNEYVEENYAAYNWLLAKDSSHDKVSDAGKTIVNMSRANYKNAIYMDRLNKRLGEARYINSEDDQGMWVRLRHDRIGHSGEFRSMNTMYELGYDVKQDCDNGERRLGFAVDYMRGSTSYSDIIGKGETKRYGLWLYDTWLGDKGHYADYVLKWGHLSNDFDIFAKTSGENITGDYSNNVFSASAEYGRKKDIGNDWYFEPQAQLQLARVTGADYVSSQDTKVSVDGINSLIGRAGFRLGKDLGERSTVYVKADLLHEFLGDQTITASDATGTFRETYENKGTWYDVGFGFATAMGKNSYAFMDFEKSFGNDNDETYQINAGVQWTF